MTSLQFIIPICWVIFLLYWAISARSVKPIQQTQGWLGGKWHRLLLLLGFLFLLKFQWLGRFGVPVDTLGILLIPHTALASIITVLFAVAGLVIAIIARKTLADNWSASVALKEDHTLITTGLYGYVRHPIYTGILTMIFGTLLAYGTLAGCIGFLIILLSFWLKLRDEEALLSQHFPEEYWAYKKRTKMLIPFIW